MEDTAAGDAMALLVGHDMLRGEGAAAAGGAAGPSLVCFVDTETTGTNPGRPDSRIVQAAALRCDSGLEPLAGEALDMHVNPGPEALSAMRVPRPAVPPWRSEPAGGPRLERLVRLATEGLRPAAGRMLAAAGGDLGGLAMGEALDILAAAEGREPDPVEVTAPYDIHRIDESTLRAAPRWDTAGPRIAGLLAGSVMVAHSAEFDYRFIAAEMDSAGIGNWQPAAVVCSRKLAMSVGVPPDRSRLSDMAGAFGLGSYEEHDAMADVIALWGVVRALVAVASGRRELPRELTD